MVGKLNGHHLIILSVIDGDASQMITTLPAAIQSWQFRQFCDWTTAGGVFTAYGKLQAYI